MVPLLASAALTFGGRRRLPAPGYRQEREAKTCSTSRALFVMKWKVFNRLCVLGLWTRGWASAGEGELSQEVNVLQNNPQTVPNHDEFDCVEVRYGKSKCA